MKKLLFKSFSVVFCLAVMWVFCTLTANGATEGNFTYTVADGKATITSFASSESGDIIIPSSLGGYTVTSIGDYAFKDCKSLMYIHISDSVTSLGNYSFDGCTSLKSIFIPDSVMTIGTRAFSGCTSLSTVTIPKNLAEIGSYAFSGCASLKDISISDSVENIGLGAFYDTAFYAETNNWINGLLYCGNHLIEAKNNIKVCNIKNTTVTIAEAAFSDCTVLKNINLPDSIKSIGVSAFSNCTGLKSIKIPYGVKSIKSSAFYNCTGLTEAVIPHGVTIIDNYAFYNCTALTYINLPDSVLDIGDCAFFNCSGLYALTIPYGVYNIGNRAFENCTSIKNIAIMYGVRNIGEYAFANCKSLNGIALPGSVTYVGTAAFKDCQALKSITIPDRVMNIGRDVLTNTAFYKNIGNWKNGVLYCDNHLISAKPAITSCSIKDTTVTIADFAFSSCKKLSSITMPDGVKNIGKGVMNATPFYNKVSNWKNDVLYCGNHLIAAKPNITACCIKNSTKTIADFAFAGCKQLKNVDIPQGVTNIGKEAFADCVGLKTVAVGVLSELRF